jgi:hypothetical protein
MMCHLWPWSGKSEKAVLRLATTCTLGTMDAGEFDEHIFAELRQLVVSLIK